MVVSEERERGLEGGAPGREGEWGGSLSSLCYKSPLFRSSLNRKGSRATASRFAQEGGSACETESDLSAHRAPSVQLLHLLVPTSSEMAPELTGDILGARLTSRAAKTLEEAAGQ